MSVLARLLNDKGVKVSGSDVARTEITKDLEKAGLRVYPQDGSHMGDAGTLVWSSAIKEGNPDLLSAFKRGMTLAHRSDILDLLMREKEGVAVSGTHGKTTTSSLISSILLSLGKDPSWALGAPFKTEGGKEEAAWRNGKGEAFVAEADESDGSFLKYRPKVCVITNSDGDHFEHFGSIENYRRAFLDFIRHSEKCVMSMDDGGNRQLFEMLEEEEKGKVLGYGATEFKNLGLAGFQEDNYGFLEDIRFFPASSSFSSSFSLKLGKEKARVRLRIPGLHNCLNASAAILACKGLGVGIPASARAASLFLGCSRRLEFLGCPGGRKVFTDYAHHPSEIEALLSSLKSSYPPARIGALFQPFNYSRVENFSQGFASSLSLADKIFLLPVYGAREKQEDFPKASPERIKEAALPLGEGEKFELAQNFEEGARRLVSWSREGDVLVTVGAGTVTDANPLILKLLGEKV